MTRELLENAARDILSANMEYNGESAVICEEIEQASDFDLISCICEFVNEILG